MKLVVVLAGVRDPKWPFDSDHPRVLSPFDGAALELALKVRDAEPATEVVALVFGTPEDEALARSVLALKPHRLVAVSASAEQMWDLRAMAQQVCDMLIGEVPAADVVLMGRQFGDLDDGAVPACVAALSGASFVRMAHGLVTLEPGRLAAARERGGHLEFVTCSRGTVVSVTNDRNNRLRYPLLKNVMMTKKFPLVWTNVPEAGAARAVLVSLRPREERTRLQAFVRIEGADTAQRARQLAIYLREVS